METILETGSFQIANIEISKNRMSNRVVWIALLASLACLTAVRANEDSADITGQTDETVENKTFADDCRCANPTAVIWTVAADALWLQPSTGENVLLGRTYDVFSGATVQTLSSSDAVYAMQPGVRFRLALQVDDETRWEATYFGLQNWSAGQAIRPDIAAGQLASSPWTQSDQQPFGIGGFDGSLGLQISSRLQNVELNRQHQWIDNSSWSVGTQIGIRYFEWEESLQFSGSNTFPFPVYEEIDVHSNNHLLGPQFGIELLRRWDRFQVRLDGRTGLFANFVRQSRWNGNSTGVQPGGFPPINLLSDSNQSTGVAGVIDLSMTAAYHLGAHLAMRGGYQVLYVAGLGLAPNQLAGYSHGSDLLLQGPSAGLEVTW
jgi:hypothetical protein